MDQKDETRQKLIEAAKSELGERGFTRTKVADITSRAGFAKGTFYLYFKKKEDVLTALFAEMGFEINDILDDCFGKYTGNGATFSEIIEEIAVRTAHAYVDMKDIVMATSYLNFEISPELAKARDRAKTLIQKKMASILEAAQEKGHMKKLDPLFTAHLFIMMFVNVSLEYTFKDGMVNMDHHISTTLELVLRGMEVQEGG